ncbi:phospholipase [Histomonas meleagridis]|uniref:phospholipase n=1 Tax=Histomonas meleagridis TaxID=135588 RepID=UPI00355A626D|nr:phospholipase [Histomonas meleagridis]KAH0803896.1 phospholipase [Histomonas meleagridis]
MFFALVCGALSWRFSQHKALTRQALEILKAEQPKAYDFFNNKYADYWNDVIWGSWDPDIFEFGTGTHYYVYPDDGSENVGQYYPNAPRHKNDESSRTRLEGHWKDAIEEFKSGKLEKTFLSLGRALHYLGDIGCPPHSGGIQYPKNIFETNYHSLFEKYAKILVDGAAKYHATSAKGYYGKLDEATFGVEINKLCQIAASNKDLVLTKDEAKWDQAIVNSFPYAEIYAAVLLERFYREVQ